MVKNQRGWTLVEILIAVAILGILATLAPRMLTLSTTLFMTSRSRIDAQRDARNSISLITRELRQATASSITITRLPGQPYYSFISFQKSNGVNVSFWQSNTTLSMKEGNVVSILSKNLSCLFFTFPHSDDMSIVSVSLSLQQTVFGGASRVLHMASEKVEVMNS